jgi:ABC-2 type transport system permease protein
LRLRKSAWAWLLEKEWRELLSSRAWWVLLVVIGPLVGFAFISSVRSYAEASGLNGTAAGVGEAFSPLVGIWAPTFSACELASVFLLPFVAIRVVAGDRQSGALKLELQHAMSALARVAAKALVLLGGWVIASVPVVAALVLWRSYGGSIYVPELATVAIGHVINAGLTIGIAAATASITEHPSTAAILTLTVTVGTWILNFIAAVQGGIWDRLASYTPTTMVSDFQHGLVKLDAVIAAVTLIVLGLGLAALWIRLGVPVRRRTAESIAATVVALLVIVAGSATTRSWDTSESRLNSFSKSDEQALRSIPGPLTIEVHLAPEDPRRVDLDHRVISKLRRVRPDVNVRYESATSIGLFEQTSAGYGEIWYEIQGKKAMSRAVTAESVLDTMYSLAGVSPAAENGEIFRGHPLMARPAKAALVFYVLWPALIVSAAIATQGKR